VDPDKQEIVIRTTVKKYFKRFDVPDLKRMNIKLDKALLSFAYKNSTLIVSVLPCLPSTKSLS
jgi:protein DPCD